MIIIGHSQESESHMFSMQESNISSRAHKQHDFQELTIKPSLCHETLRNSKTPRVLSRDSPLESKPEFDDDDDDEEKKMNDNQVVFLLLLQSFTLNLHN